jgi:PTH1 family peptidyl-tRNA hydrolase
VETDPSLVGLLVLAVLMLAGAVLALRWFRRRRSRSAAMPPPDLLIVGLGNPGPDYAGTRHNAGFDVVERIADRLGVGPFYERAREFDEALTVEAIHEGRRLLLVQPLTFMNRSGRSVAKLFDRFGMDERALVVVYDDLALPLGAVRLRPKGSAGGHNGVQDLITRLGTDQFDRVRVGIGSRFGHGQQVDYVLGPYDADEREAAEEALGYAAEATLGIVEVGLPEAMGRFNRKASPVEERGGADGEGS